MSQYSLFRIRKYSSLKMLRSILFAIFDSYLPYCCLAWAQNCSTILRIAILQRKAVTITEHSQRILKHSSILKFQDKICLENDLFVRKYFNNLSPSVFSRWFSFSSEHHNYETWSSTQGNLTNVFIRQIDMGSIQQLKVLLSCGTKSENNKKICCLKIYPPIKLKLLLVIFVLNHINKSC